MPVYIKLHGMNYAITYVITYEPGKYDDLFMFNLNGQRLEYVIRQMGDLCWYDVLFNHAYLFWKFEW